MAENVRPVTRVLGTVYTESTCVLDSQTLKRPGIGPSAYLITFACYGARIYGDPDGSVDRYHNLWQTPILDATPRRARFERRLLRDDPVNLGAAERQLVLEAIQQHAAHRGWKLHAAHVRSNHVHVVVKTDLAPETAMVQLKAYASRALNQSGWRRRKHWGYHGSTRYLWDPGHVDAAVGYVVSQQGPPMAVFLNPNRWEPIQSPERK